MFVLIVQIRMLKYKNMFLGLAAVLVSLSLLAMLFWGFKKSIDFTGGAKVVFNVNQGTINNDNNIYAENLQKVLAENFGEVKLKSKRILL